MLQLLTMTGCRPEAFDLCQRWMMNQNYTGPVHWIIVDDGETSQPIWFEREEWSLTVLRPEPFWKEGDNTQKRNILAGMAEATDQLPLVIIEDDDYYHPQWLSTVNRYMKKFELVGEKNAQYYNVETNIHKNCGNDRHASLCSTAVRGEAFHELLRQARTNDKFIDINLWKSYRGLKRLIDTNYVVGMKGLPGRSNIGIGKRLKGNTDVNGEILKRLIGEDAQFYEQFN